MQHFTPISALIGGALIGISATLLLWLNGRIAGISGIFYNAASFPAGDTLWRWLFLLGLVVGAGAYVWSVPLPFELRQGVPLPLLVAAGFIVGFGTQMGSGCTSGHGVCGIARFSPRSVVATLTFMSTAMITVYVLRHVIGLNAGS